MPGVARERADMAKLVVTEMASEGRAPAPSPPPPGAVSRGTGVMIACALLPPLPQLFTLPAAFGFRTAQPRDGQRLRKGLDQK